MCFCHFESHRECSKCLSPRVDIQHAAGGRLAAADDLAPALLPGRRLGLAHLADRHAGAVHFARTAHGRGDAAGHRRQRVRARHLQHRFVANTFPPPTISSHAVVIFRDAWVAVDRRRPVSLAGGHLALPEEVHAPAGRHRRPDHHARMSVFLLRAPVPSAVLQLRQVFHPIAPRSCGSLKLRRFQR